MSLLRAWFLALALGCLAGCGDNGGGPGHLEEVAQAQADLETFANAIERFRVDTDSYPTSEQGLPALTEAPYGVKDWKGPYLAKQIPADPWGNDYEYEGDKTTYTIFSYGSDGAEGGVGKELDIVRSSD